MKSIAQVEQSTSHPAIPIRCQTPELTQAETRAILQRALGPDTTEEIITMIHSVTGGVFRSVDMMIPQPLELRQRNEKKLAEGSVKMQDLVKTAASRLMI